MCRPREHSTPAFPPSPPADTRGDPTDDTSPPSFFTGPADEEPAVRRATYDQREEDMREAFRSFVRTGASFW